MSELIQVEVRDDVTVISLTNPPVNALSQAVCRAVFSAVEDAARADDVCAIIITGAGKTFSGGADISEFGSLQQSTSDSEFPIHSMINGIENCSKPVIAAIHGNALGGGLETAIGCHYRIAVADARVGFPEVNLGLIPGAMGTQRLPRLCGLPKAAEICASGEMIPARVAHELGIIDRITDGDLLDDAHEYARELVGMGDAPRKTSEITDRLGDIAENAIALEQLRKVVSKRARGQESPFRCIEAVEAAGQGSFEDGSQNEFRIFAECLQSTQSQGLIHAFFGERAVSKVPGITKDTPRRPVDSAAVIGAGTMGGGITMAYVNAGIPVIIKEVSQEQLEKGIERIRQTYGISVKRGRMAEADVDRKMTMITGTTDYARISDADIIVEAAFEGMDLKKQIFGELDRIAKPGAILASNTSTLDIDAIAAVTGRPESVIGHHFFSPANVMKLLEMVRGKETADDVIATSMDLAKRLRKVGVLVGNCFGFVGNRMFWPYQREAQFVLEEGATVAQVDNAHLQFGMAMGPHAVSDLSGIDVFWRINQEIKDTIPIGMRQPLVSDRLYELGHYGQKIGAGWYRYEGRNAIPDPEVQQLIESCAAEAGIARRDVSDEEIIERTMFSMANEGALILQEGIAMRSVDIDIVYLYGYGFPAWRGGPMKYADTVGLKKVYDRICYYREAHGFWWEPAPLLRELAESGGTFSGWSAS
ncbi:MAG: 3-hydroxyacyl-CoA dehydrogenase NAD-binding domain-containing protein [Fuerstiella sp.]|nr:3-hydroxyacyl-CoA dehydrogenase NAD-binding domain-containing protein [Fuerstiella sp.]